MGVVGIRSGYIESKSCNLRSCMDGFIQCKKTCIIACQVEIKKGVSLQSACISGCLVYL